MQIHVLFLIIQQANGIERCYSFFNSFDQFIDLAF